ncbi:MAG: hypothetical protein M3177_03275 [Pseudomonadota bacterium]|nr:hypothetical protein [Pseudomonadota bacterium]
MTKRPLLAAAAALLGACAEAPGEYAGWQGQAIDGVWVAETIDGRGVGRMRYTIEVAEGRVTGGHDGCNGWGYEIYKGQRTVNSTLIGCPSDPLHEGYWAVVRPEPWAARLLEDGRLEASAPGHRVVLRRER